MQKNPAVRLWTFQTTLVRGLLFFEVFLYSSVQTGTQPPGVLHFRIGELLFGEALRQIVLLEPAKVKGRLDPSES